VFPDATYGIPQKVLMLSRKMDEWPALPLVSLMVV
jgi:hypothetical protein